jgi:hypothetical protein
MYTTVLQPTIRQQVKKIRIIGDRVAFAGAGPTGLLGLYHDELANLWMGNELNKKLTEAVEIIREAFWKHYDPLHKQTAQVIATLSQMALLEAMASALVALPIANRLHLLQYSETCTPNEIQGDQLFVAIGSGQWVAEPFLVWIKRMFWKDKQPTVVQGVFAALLTLDYAIRCSAIGLSDPKQIVTLQRDSKGKWAARELSDAELGEQMQAVGEAEAHMAEYPRAIDAAEAALTPPPPPK